MSEGWGDRLIAVAGTLAAVAVIGAFVTVAVSYVDKGGADGMPLWIAYLWGFGSAAMHSPKLAWIGLLVLAALQPWLARQPAWVWAMAGLVVTLPFHFQPGTRVDLVIRLTLGLVYGEVFRRLIAFRFRTYFDRQNQPEP